MRGDADHIRIQADIFRQREPELFAALEAVTSRQRARRLIQLGAYAAMRNSEAPGENARMAAAPAVPSVPYAAAAAHPIAHAAQVPSSAPSQEIERNGWKDKLAAFD